MSKKNNYTLRWIVKKDMGDIESIDCSAFGESGWTKRKFVQALNQKNTIGLVCEYMRETRGYIIYTLRPDHIEVVRICVDPLYIGEGVGTKLIQRIIEKIEGGLRNTVKIVVPEDYLRCHLFLKKNGFKACKIIRGGIDELDSYEFVYKESVVSKPA